MSKHSNDQLGVKESKIDFKFNAQAYTLIIALVLIAILFSVLTGGEFLSSRNLSNLFTQMAAIVVGALLGLFQGWWIAYRGLPAFIVTLGGMLIFRGILIGISKGLTIAPLDNSFKMIANSYLPLSLGYVFVLIGITLLFVFTWRNRNSRIHMGLNVPSSVMDYGKLVIYSMIIVLITYMLSRYNGLPVPLLIVITLAGIFIFISAKTAFGRSIYAIGGNPEAARLSGINLKRNTLMVFVLMGALAGIAGVILTSRLNAATTSAGICMS